MWWDCDVKHLPGQDRLGTYARCRIEPYLDQGGAAARRRGAPAAGLCAWGARPARARCCKLHGAVLKPGRVLGRRSRLATRAHSSATYSRNAVTVVLGKWFLRSTIDGSWVDRAGPVGSTQPKPRAERREPMAKTKNRRQRSSEVDHEVERAAITALAGPHPRDRRDPPPRHLARGLPVGHRKTPGHKPSRGPRSGSQLTAGVVPCHASCTSHMCDLGSTLELFCRRDQV